jgi:RNA polymerase sigma-70 factor (ECF subfamily)
MDHSNLPSPHSDLRTREFVELLGAHDAQLHAFILSLMPNWADAHEIAQDVRLRLWEQFDQYDRQGDFGAWARTIAYYKVLAFRKSSRRRPQLFDNLVELIADDAAREAAQGEERHRALMHCMQSLDVRQRELLVRYYAGTQTFKEIAAELHSSFDALRQRVLRTRRALAKCVERQLRSES